MAGASIVSKYFSFVSGFISKSPATNVIGFDIGTSAVKAVEIACADNVFEIKNWALEPINGSNALEALKKICSRMNIKDQIHVASVSGKGTLIRYVDMPRMSIEDLRKSFVYEADKYFPFDPQTIYTDCSILDPQSKDKKASILVVAVKKEMVEDRLKLFQEAGIELSCITTNSIATANAFERLVKQESKEGARAILDIGGSVSNLMILDKNNSPCFTRDIYVGSQEISKQIANNLGMELKKADALKLAPAERTDDVMKACEAAIENLNGEVHLSFDYFMTEKNIAVSELFLVGGGSLFKGIEGVIEKNINIPVKVWNPLQGLKLADRVSMAEINSYSSQLGVAIGLALTKV